jgi:hypothetical protein
MLNPQKRLLVEEIEERPVLVQIEVKTDNSP